VERIGNYQILRKLGRGGMGAVYKALDPDLDKVVAIKILKPFENMVELLGYDKLRDIFAYEASTMVDLNHPSVVKVLSYEAEEGSPPFFVMEFFCNNLGKMIGEDFKVDKRSRLIRPEKVLDYGRQLLESLVFLYRHQVIHRDIKPQNIMIADDDTVKICDFGMALVGNRSFIGPAALQVGSPFYAAPEQQRDPNGVDGRADLYSAGVLLYRMLTGELPSMRGFSLSRVNPLFDESWDHFFAVALSLHPVKRFQTAEEMAESLSSLRLHWDRLGRKEICREANCDPLSISLRKEPVNACGKTALEVFGLNESFRPEVLVANRLLEAEDGVEHDLATGLYWQKTGSGRAMSWVEGRDYVDELNRSSFGGRNDWRLPTVNELFSLFTEADPQPRAATELPRSGWFWSCDLHGKRDGWYVNLEMGYADNQDLSCRNFIRAVA